MKIGKKEMQRPHKNILSTGPSFSLSPENIFYNKNK